MTTKQVLFRLDDSKLIALDNKLSDKGISKQFFLSKCVELFLEDKLSFDNNVITNDSSEIVELKKQIAIINERLSKLEGDSNIKDGDNSVIASDNSPIQSNEPLGIEKTEIGLVDNILSAVNHKEDITENITISELPILPLNEDLGVIVPDTENEGDNSDIVSSDDELVNLSTKQREILKKMKAIETGKIFKSQNKLAEFLGVGNGDTSKLKPYWENKIFSIEFMNGSNQLTRI